MEKCRVIVDTNLWISLLIGKKLAELRILCNHQNISVYNCKELTDEFIKVASRPKIRKYVTEQNIADISQLMEVSCLYNSINTTAVSIIRDTKDLYLLSLADTVKANYIITGDNDLLVLKRHNNTQIVTFSEFMAKIS
ncbi:MAG: putative toxin-antitoxin system toxin component, PIN family [Tannerella sp.]|jgi:putative PIN family toxin of toxin-antitoxin system|nr:putative toxin-antitoxin system toxin component, PIN family [Tannerella sp.]